MAHNKTPCSVLSSGGSGVRAGAVPERERGAVGADSGQGAGQEQGAVHAQIQGSTIYDIHKLSCIPLDPILSAFYLINTRNLP